MKSIFAAVLLAKVYAAEAEAETATETVTPIIPVGYKTSFTTTPWAKNTAIVYGEYWVETSEAGVSTMRFDLTSKTDSTMTVKDGSWMLTMFTLQG